MAISSQIYLKSGLFSQDFWPNKGNWTILTCNIYQFWCKSGKNSLFYVRLFGLTTVHQVLNSFSPKIIIVKMMTFDWLNFQIASMPRLLFSFLVIIERIKIISTQSLWFINYYWHVWRILVVYDSYWLLIEYLTRLAIERYTENKKNLSNSKITKTRDFEILFFIQLVL